MWRFLDLISRLLLKYVISYDKLRRNQRLLFCMQALYLKDDVSDEIYQHYVRKISITVLMTIFTGIMTAVNLNENRWVWFVLGLGLTAGLIIKQDQNVYQRMKAREYQMIIDYPKLISELTLLHQAGISIYQSLRRIVANYEKKEEKRFAYEEVRILIGRLEKNCLEMEAFSRFGQRCHLHCYMKLANLMAQNMKKGNKEFSYLLQTEVVTAYESRKMQAIKQAQETETKLLLPMGMELVIVMALIMIPAIFNLSL